MKTISTGYKFVTSKMKSKSGNVTWQIGKWNKHKGKLVMCQSGFHYCKEPLDAFDYTYGSNLALVEVRGEEQTGENKSVTREMRVIKVVDVKKIAVRFAIACARRSLSKFEDKYPNDSRPRKAIESAENWILSPTKDNSATAHAATATAYAAAYTAYTAYAAAHAATATAYAAAYTAHAAAYAAHAATYAAHAAYAAYAAHAATTAAHAAHAATYAATTAATATAYAAAHAATATAYAATAIRKTERDWQNNILKTIIEEEM